MGGFLSAPRPTAASPNIKFIPKLTGMTFVFGLAAVGLGALKNPPMDRSSLKKILGLVTKKPAGRPKGLREAGSEHTCGVR